MHSVENLLRLARPHGALQRTAGEVQTSLTDPLAGQQELLKLIEDLVLHLDADALEVGHGLCDLLDLVVGEKLHHLPAGLLAEGDEEDGHLLHDRKFTFFLALIGGIVAFISHLCALQRLRVTPPAEPEAYPRSLIYESPCPIKIVGAPGDVLSWHPRCPAPCLSVDSLVCPRLFP